MAKINNIHIPLKTMIQVQKEKRFLKKAGNKEIVTTANKNGDVAILAFNNPQHDELILSHVIKKDGSQTVSYYNTSEKKYRTPFVKVIETYDKLKNNIIFNKQSTIKYNGTSKIPEEVSTMYSDKDGCDGVEIKQKFPFKEYSKHFQKPQE
jgi:hypothetical protein